ncbi:hypothetical protein N665_0699s0005 [Sinapis alba]|nr:hypothetical protein N665_0699s0005 [Sinapis alba]
MVFDAGGGLARRRHRFPTSCSVLLASCVLVMLSASIPVAPPSEILRSATSSCLRLTISSDVCSCPHHRCFHVVIQGRAFVVTSSAQPASPHHVFVTTSRCRHSPSSVNCLAGFPSAYFPFANETVSFLQGVHDVTLHCPDPFPAPLTAIAPPLRIYIFPHLGRFLVSRVLAHLLLCITSLPSQKEAPRILLEWRPDCNGVKPPPTEALRSSPNDGSRPLKSIVVVDWLLRCRSVTFCWSWHGNVKDSRKAVSTHYVTHRHWESLHLRRSPSSPACSSSRYWSPLLPRLILPWSKMSSNSCFSGDSRVQLQLPLASSAHRRQHHSSADPALFGDRPVRPLPFLFMTFPRLVNLLRHPPPTPAQVQRQASASDVNISSVRGTPLLTWVLELGICYLSRWCSPPASFITTVAGLPSLPALPSSSPLPGWLKVQGSEDAAGLVSTSFRGADWMSTSQLKVTISLLSDHVVKAVLTHSNIVLSSLSFSSFEDLSFLPYDVVVYAFNQRGCTFPSIICNRAS